MGPGAYDWLVEANAGGAQRIRARMARAVELAAVLGADVVDDSAWPRSLADGQC